VLYFGGAGATTDRRRNCRMRGATGAGRHVVTHMGREDVMAMRVKQINNILIRWSRDSARYTAAPRREPARVLEEFRTLAGAVRFARTTPDFLSSHKKMT
jgi:hypothetical protein